MLRHVDLCSGIGGFALGFEWAELSSPVLFCDIEPWSRKILAKHWPDVPIAEDVKELANDPNGLIPDCDILTAGYPCQPFSVAGQRKGQEDDRHIWPYIRKIVAQKRPTWCVFENVYGHISLGLDEVLSDLEVEGYAARTFIVPACATDAPHRRDRLWIIAKNVGNARCAGGKSRGNAEAREKTFGGAAASQYKRSGQNVAHASRLHSNGSGEHTQQSERQVSQLGDSRGSDNVARAAGRQSDFWLPEPPVGRVANGIPRRVDRLRGLGNAIVPQIAMRIGMTIKETG
jgi:DNA (cytosine-5)-methyltransferase 1